MSLLVLMYHRARAGRHGNAPDLLDSHFAHISRTYPNVLPGDVLAPGTPNVCLSFDDGYFDFYAIVYPLLRKHNLRALLAIPPAVVRARLDITSEERLQIDSDDAFARPDRGGFCSWAELAEMTASGHVTVAAHGFTHVRLDAPEASLGTEVEMAQTVLRAQLKQPIESFVFPFGRYSQRSLQKAQDHYRYVFRIGGALNDTWESQLLYRIDADAMETARSLFSSTRLLGYRARYFWNLLRGR